MIKIKDKNRTIIIPKTFLVIFIVLFLSFSFNVRTSSAIPVAIVGNIWKQIKDMQLGIMKTIQAKIINKTINKIIGGQDASFIRNWEETLVDEPISKSKIFINDYITQATRGRGSASQYVTLEEAAAIQAGSSSNISSTNYPNQLKNYALNATSRKARLFATYNNDPSKMFANGTFRNLDWYVSGINNPWAFNVKMKAKYDDAIQQNKTIAETRAIAYQGFEGEEKNGKISMPGSVVTGIAINAETIGNEIIANATTIEELAASVITNMATQAIQRGL